VQAGRSLIRQDLEQASVTPLELFFDLVFVFALTQVTAFMAEELSWQGILRGALVIMLLWWAWVGYAWLANVASAEERPIKLAILAGMAAMFILALCIPEAFDDAPGGLDGPVVLAICYLLFRLMHLVIFLIISREDAGLRAQVLRFALSVVASSVVLLVASQFDGWLQTGLWMLALLADYVGTALGGFRGWRLPAPGHFSERHGLIIIVALGESIVALGIGASELSLDVKLVGVAVLGLALVSCPWWAYFGGDEEAPERALTSAPRERRPGLAFNAFGYAYLALLLGIIAVAAGLEHAIGHPFDDLDLAHALELAGGVAVFLAGMVAFRLILGLGSVGWRAGALVAALATIPLGTTASATVQIAALVLILVTALSLERTRSA
jgi:low temperature requirement protein LtrA